MTKRFGPAKAAKAERCVKHLKGKFGSDSSSPFAICTSAMSGKRSRGR